MRSEGLTNALLLVVPAGLVGGALAFQYVGGLQPCEMCMWQRWALVATLAVGLLAWVMRSAKPVVTLTALALLVDGGIAVFHAGVERHWWQGITKCTAPLATGSASEMLSEILSQPLIRCDAIPWSLFGLSMAGWNAVIAILVGGYALWRLKTA